MYKYLLYFLPFSLLGQELEVKSHFDAYQVDGSFILHHLEKNNSTFYKENKTEEGYIPASTFKIPNSLIALELGIMEDAKTMIFWDGIERSISAWNKDMTFGEALQVSCVPCYQQIARKVGVENYHVLLNKLDYGNMDVQVNNLDQFWLRGESKISPKEQLNFLKKLYKEELPLSNRSMRIVKDMLLLEETEEYRLFGKTGWAVNGMYNVGWFVGWVENASGTYFFVTHVHALSPKEDLFIRSRKEITQSILSENGLLN